MPIEKPNNEHGYKPRTLQEIYRQMPDMEIPAGMAAARRERQQTPQYLSKSLRILTPIGYHADYPNSMRVLEENNLRPLTYKEVLAILTENEEIKGQLKGMWFWIAGEGSVREGWHHFDGNDLVKGQVADIEKNVYYLTGEYPLSFRVRSDNDARYKDRRFTFGANERPVHAASAVVGVPK